MKAQNFRNTATRLFTILICLRIVLAAGPACFARTYTIVDTGQTVFYDDASRQISPPKPGQPFYGQDAQYQGNQISYRDNNDGTITDLNTGLIWQKTPPPGHYTWQQAAAYARNLRLAGHDDWRIPTIKELYSLTAFYGNIRTRTPYIDTDYFDFEYPDTSKGFRLIDAQYWSSSKYVGRTMRGDTSAFGFNFADGRIKSYPTGEGRGPTKRSYLRCVRGPADYGLNDFVDNGDGTITDRATGLMWTKADSAATLNWRQALEYAESLDHAGHTDWRLPNAKELHSIVDYTRAPDAADPNRRTAAIDPIFGLTETESWFWTGTTHNDNGFGIYICFGRAPSAWEWRGEKMNAHGAGAQRSDPKKGNPRRYADGLGPQGDQIRIYNYVRCVRDAGDVAPVPGKAPVIMQTSQWGARANGLQCKVSAPLEIEQGMPLQVKLQFKKIPEDLQPRVKQVNTFMRDAFLRLLLKKTATARALSLRPHDPTRGMLALDMGRDVVRLDQSSPGPWRVSFPLIRRGNAIAPGLYRCTVEFSFPKGRTRWWSRGTRDWDSCGFWHGTVVSGPFQLRVLKETPKTKSFFLPQRLHSREDGKPYFRKEDGVRVELPVRNGFFVGAKYLNAAGELISLGALPQPGPHALHGGLPMTITIFETSDPPCHFWAPSPGAGGYKVLWEKTFNEQPTERN